MRDPLASTELIAQSSRIWSLRNSLVLANSTPRLV